MKRQQTLYIDGGKKSGSGTILRYALTISALLQKPIKIVNIRAKREQPGLRPQHLKSVLALAQLVGGKVEGAKIGSTTLIFTPKKMPEGGRHSWEIGTAGSTLMLLMTVLPALLFARRETVLKIEGGLFQDFAPSPYHTQHVLSRLLKRMGIDFTIEVEKPGYYPKGSGILKATIQRTKGKIKPITLTTQGKLDRIEGISIASHLKGRKVTSRMIEGFKDGMIRKGFGLPVDIKQIEDESAIQPGAALAVWLETLEGCIIGADKPGAVGRRAEDIGWDVANMLADDVESKATVDRHTADQLILYCALADGVSQYRIPEITDHIESNIWLVKELLGANVKISNNLLTLQGISYTPHF